MRWATGVALLAVSALGVRFEQKASACCKWSGNCGGSCASGYCSSSKGNCNGCGGTWCQPPTPAPTPPPTTPQPTPAPTTPAPPSPPPTPAPAPVPTPEL